jgi:hypothetical protein
MFYLWRAPDHVSRFDFLYRASPFLCPANASRNDQALPCRVRVPSGSGPWLEGDIRSGKVRRIIGRKQTVYTDVTGKKFGRPIERTLRSSPKYRLRRFVGCGGQGTARHSACCNEESKQYKHGGVWHVSLLTIVFEQGCRELRQSEGYGEQFHFPVLSVVTLSP